MKLLSRLSEKLKGPFGYPTPEHTVISQPLIAPQSNSVQSIVTEKDAEFLRALKQIYIREPLRSYGLKLYPGEFSERLGRVTSEKCRTRRCLDCEPHLVAVHHTQKGLALFSCRTCKNFLIRLAE